MGASMGSATFVNISYNSFCRGSSSQHPEDRAMYSTSMMLKAIDVWSLLPLVTGQLLTHIRYPIQDLTQCGSALYFVLYRKAKLTSQ